MCLHCMVERVNMSARDSNYERTGSTAPLLHLPVDLCYTSCRKLEGYRSLICTPYFLKSVHQRNTLSWLQRTR